jgi:hypothetical protein
MMTGNTPQKFKPSVPHRRWYVHFVQLQAVLLGTGVILFLAQMTLPLGADDVACSAQIRAGIEKKQPGDISKSCWRLGSIKIGMTRDEVNRLLGTPDSKSQEHSGYSTVIYIYPRDLASQLARRPLRPDQVVHSELTLSFVANKLVYIHALYGGGSPLPFRFAELSIGAPASAFVRKYGDFSSTNRSKDLGIYAPIPLGVEFDPDTGNMRAFWQAGSLFEFWHTTDKATGFVNGYKVEERKLGTARDDGPGR